MKMRHWDIEEKYTGVVLKEYKHWVLETHFKQVTLGSFIIFAKRKIEKISELNKKELVELTQVMKEIEAVLTKLYHPERFNYLQLGNQLHHLHFHGIPRYSEEKTAYGRIWKDENYGHPPKWPEQELKRKLILKITNDIRKAIKS